MLAGMPRPSVPARAIAALALSAALGLAACSSGDDTSQASAEAAATEAAQPSVADKAEGRTIIDVRTPEEFAAGHVDGAVNIDVQGPSFDEQVAELPADGSYLVYCRSGSRSAVAAARMAELGFADVLDGGAFDALVAAGLPTA